MSDHTAQKVTAGHYKYRGFDLYHEETEGPEGGMRRYWSIGDCTGFAVADNPHLATLRACKCWVDAHLAGKYANGAEGVVWAQY